MKTNDTILSVLADKYAELQHRAFVALNTAPQKVLVAQSHDIRGDQYLALYQDGVVLSAKGSPFHRTLSCIVTIDGVWVKNTHAFYPGDFLDGTEVDWNDVYGKGFYWPSFADETMGRHLLDAAGVSFNYEAYTDLWEGASQLYAPETTEEVFGLTQTHPEWFTIQ